MPQISHISSDRRMNLSPFSVFFAVSKQSFRRNISQAWTVHINCTLKICVGSCRYLHQLGTSKRKNSTKTITPKDSRAISRAWATSLESRFKHAKKHTHTHTSSRRMSNSVVGNFPVWKLCNFLT